ncbi:MAG: VWA domain-containing protein [bacterium]|nr:VWA domain-containing protein [bacterium]
MGNGYRDSSVLNFQIAANYNMSATDIGLWQRAFSKASELMWNATQGQLRIGTIWVSEDNMGVNNAEFVLDPATGGRALGTWGKFGQLGQAIQLPAYAQSQVLSIIHELGHHLWTLSEEYARSEGAAIDDGAALPAGHGNTIIPLVDTDLDEPDANYTGADVLLKFAGGGLETREISSKVGDRITVTAAFSQNPQNDENGSLTIQWVDNVECTGDRSTGACIMEFSRGSAGTLASDGTWTPASNPVTEFCTTANHDSDADTDQEKRHGEACWMTIVDRPGFTDLSSGAPAATGAASTTMPAGWTAPQWIELQPNVRLALVLDRSGSMNRNGGARLLGVKTGAKFWIENAAVESDELTIVWYDPSTDTQLGLTPISSLSATEIQDELDAIEAQVAGGKTNIRDGLAVALSEILSPGTLAATQASVLITDGAHNRPIGTEMDEVLPDYDAANTNIYTLGVGTGAEMDLAGLDDLATRAGGVAQTVGDGSDATAIQDKMIEINAVVRGGMLSTTGSGGGDTREVEDKIDKRFAEDLPPEKRPTLDELAEGYGVVHWQKILAGEQLPHRYTWFGLQIEDGAHAATFTLSHDNGARYWMYLIDPTGQEVHPTASEVLAWTSSPEPYEFAKINKPVAGQWIVLALRIDRGPAVHSRTIAAISHPEINVFAKANWTGPDCPVGISAGARHIELLTGLRATAHLRNSGGSPIDLPLHDSRGDGDYRAWAALPPGRYEGYVEIRSPGNTPVAGLDHAILHAERPEDVDTSPVRHGAFVRHVPISFTVGRIAPPKDFSEEWEGEEPKRPYKKAAR